MLRGIRGGAGLSSRPFFFAAVIGPTLASGPRKTGTRRAATAVVLYVQLGATFSSRYWFELHANRAARTASNGGAAGVRGDQVVACGRAREDEAGEGHGNGVQVRHGNDLLRTGIAHRDCPEVQRGR